MRFVSTALLAAATLVTGGLIACSSSTTTIPSGQGAADAGAIEAGSGETDAGAVPAGPMTLTSSAFEDGEVLPAIHTCDGEGGKKELSPPLSWTPGPEGTLSYAVVFKDETNGLVHSAIYDIPATVTSLPQGVEGAYEPAKPAGAKQALNYKSQPGYAGPCPPDGEHDYVFTLYALKVETLSGLTSSSKASAVEKAVQAEDLKTAKLKTRYTRK